MSDRFFTVALLIFTLSLVGCASETESVEAGAGDGGTTRVITAEEAVPLIEGGDHVIIDVRTPEEFAQGHIAGAVNYDIEGAAFEDQIAGLATAGTYIVYCRSGNRSASAATAMTPLGLNVLDGGGFADLVVAGAPTG